MIKGDLNLPADPVVVYLAGFFVGVTMGERVLRAARVTLMAQSNEITSQLLDRFLTTLKVAMQDEAGERAD